MNLSFASLRVEKISATSPCELVKPWMFRLTIHKCFNLFYSRRDIRFSAKHHKDTRCDLTTQLTPRAGENSDSSRASGSTLISGEQYRLCPSRDR
jgi:hypothetical protein